MNAPEKNVSIDTPLLSLDSVSKSFGGIRALGDISFVLPENSITGLIGPNGAGKTTLFNLITGIFPADSGEIVFRGRSIQDREVHDLVNLGIARTFQNVELFAGMTVLENIQVGLHTRTRCGIISSILKTSASIREERSIRSKALELLSFIGLAEHADRRSGDLPFGWQRLLELARALAAAPSLLLLDEPAAGLNLGETARLGDLIKNIRDQGIAVLLVEHDMSLTMNVSDNVVVLDQGEKIAEGPPRAIQSDEAVLAAYLGKAQ